MLTVSALNSLLAMEAKGTFFLRNILIDYVNDEHLEKILVQVGKVYEQCQKTERSLFTPVFNFIETQSDGVRLTISRVGRHQEKKQVGYLDLIAGAKGLALATVAWKNVTKDYWPRIMDLKDLRGRLEVVKGLLSETQQTLINFHLNILQTAAASRKLEGLVYDLEFSEHGIMVIVYEKGRIYTNFFIAMR